MEPLKDFLAYPLFRIAKATMTPGRLLTLVALMVLVYLFTHALVRFTSRRVIRRGKHDPGVVQAMATISRYVLLSVGLLVVLGTVGIDLSSVVVLMGTFGLGLGLALQPLLSNFFGGIVLQLERSIKVGDRVEVGGLVGDVVSISLRAAVIITNDNIAVIVPNAQIISSQIVNWSHTDRNVRFALRVGVSYGSDPEEVKRVLLEVARAHKGVLVDPPPDVVFIGFGDSSLDFDLRFWTRDYITRPAILQSDLFFAVFRAFGERHIEIPFPQRDLHVRSGSLRIETGPPPVAVKS